jgi:DNA-binding transcriptional regulator of glucitol operon
VSGRGKRRLRGAIVVMVLRTDDEQIQAATVMEGSTVLARFKDRDDWVGLSAREPLPDCSPRAATAVPDARTRVPGRRAPLPRPRWAPQPRGGRPVKSDR